MRSEHYIQHKQPVVNSLFERAKKTFLHSPRPKKRNEVCETDTHVEWLPQMDDPKQKKQHSETP